MTTIADIQAHKATGSWRVLEALAVQIVRDAAGKAGSDFRPVMGGGTRLMLALGHRISDDIDLFIRDPQWIAYLSPRLNDGFEAVIQSYDEGATSLKLEFANGEIDFIVSMSLLGMPSDVSEECSFEMEPVAEVLAKKLFYRGWALTPRDLFDWRVIEDQLLVDSTHAPQIARLVSGRFNQIEAALTAMAISNNARVARSQIRTPYLPDLQKTIDWAKNRLGEFREMNRAREMDRQERRPAEYPDCDPT